MILQNVVPSSGMGLSSTTDLENDVPQMATEPSDVASETKFTAVRVIKFIFAHYHRKDLLLEINRIKFPDIPPHIMTDAHALFFILSFRAYGFYNATETLFFRRTTTMTRSEAPEGAPSKTLAIVMELRLWLPLMGSIGIKYA